MANFQFDARQHEPSTGQLGAIPSGWYYAAIKTSEIKPVKGSKTNYYINMGFEILDGQYKGRIVYNNFNVANDNPTTVKIAYSDLSAICHAVGEMSLQQTEQLHNRPMKIRVKYRPPSIDKDTNEQYDESNDIKAYKNVNEDVGQMGPSPGALPQAMPGASAPGTTWQPPAQGGTFQMPTQAQPQMQNPQPWQQPGQQPQQQFQPPVQQQPQQNTFAPPTQQNFAPPVQQQAPQLNQPWQQPQQNQAPQQQQPQGQQPWQQPQQQPQQAPPMTQGQPWQQPQQPQAQQPQAQPVQQQPQQQQPWAQPNQQVQQPQQQPQNAPPWAK